MIPSTEGRLQRDGADLHYVEWSVAQATPPPVLLLHGLSSNARYWDRVASQLRTRRLVALDLTPETPERAGMDELFRDIAFAVERLFLDRPVVAGHSWGAGLALEFVARHPDLASGLVFIDGPIDGVSRIFSWAEVEAFMQPPFERYAGLDEAVADSRRHLPGAWDDDLLPFVKGGLRRDGDAFVSTLRPEVRHRLLRDLFESDPQKLWPALKVPAAALIARKSDARISRSTDAGMERVAEIAPPVAITRFQTPHDIPLYAPLEVAQEIERVARSTICV
ncbi:MAG TPA: alpha/beta hydrolase [Candidatus Dormibacteraeota bacterium]|nr:alpha/beta hydrolase [Candidatus Dormibacteraeota bacterium]